MHCSTFILDWFLSQALYYLYILVSIVQRALALRFRTWLEPCSFRLAGAKIAVFFESSKLFYDFFQNFCKLANFRPTNRLFCSPCLSISPFLRPKSVQRIPLNGRKMWKEPQNTLKFPQNPLFPPILNIVGQWLSNPFLSYPIISYYPIISQYPSTSTFQIISNQIISSFLIISIYAYTLRARAHIYTHTWTNSYRHTLILCISQLIQFPSFKVAFFRPIHVLSFPHFSSFHLFSAVRFSMSFCGKQKVPLSRGI